MPCQILPPTVTPSWPSPAPPAPPKLLIGAAGRAVTAPTTFTLAAAPRPMQRSSTSTAKPPASSAASKAGASIRAVASGIDAMQPWRRLDWTLHEWVDYAWKLHHTPRHSQQVYDACTRHIQRLPGDQVAVKLDRATLLSLRSLMVESHQTRFGRPSCGRRAKHWTTPVWMDVNNQLARLNRISRRNTP